MSAITSGSPSSEERRWWSDEPDVCVAHLESDATRGLTSSEAADRLGRIGPNQITAEAPPSWWSIVLVQLADPMNLMLIAVVVVSLIIRQTPVAVVVAFLVLLNVVLGSQQELKARASVDALAKMQVPRARVIRDDALVQISATELVPGDIVQLEAGDVVPADGRLLRSATLETQEASLTGESTPVSKAAATIPDDEVTLGDRSNMLFQNTSVTRGTGVIVITDTGMATQMGRIASMLSSVKTTKSPLQRELGGLTRVLGIVAWSAVAIIVVIGLLRGQSFAAVMLLGISMAVSAIPTGLPTFVQSMLSYGARQLAEHKAVVKNLTDVETLGATSAINSDKTGTLTMNEMTVRSLYYRGEWFTVEGEGYGKAGAILQAAGSGVPDFTSLAYGLCLDSDATVSDRGEVVGDPTEAALVVLAAKMGVDAAATRRRYPRIAEVPFDSEHKFMATFHELAVERGGEPRLVALVKGGQDVVLARCTSALTPHGRVPIAEVSAALNEQSEHLSARGLRVLAFAMRELDGQHDAVTADPMRQVQELTFVGMVGIIDPLRPSSMDAVATARRAGIEVRMITGDHAITAAAIGAQLGLGQGAISGAELRALDDAQLAAALPELHVFGRVTPQDKLRLARVMQEQGDIVAMTGDAVNDAAALKQADIGVAMGSGSEVTKQAGRMILTDDNFGTLVTAIRLGRSIYDKITAYVRYQMSQLISLVLLFLIASIFGINDGTPLTPLMVLFLNFFIVVFPVVVIILDPPGDDLMTKPPRDPRVTISNPRAIAVWVLYGAAGCLVTLAALLLAPGEMSSTSANVPITMAFVVMALGSVLGGMAMRRDPRSGFTAPIIDALKWLAIPVALTVACVELGFLQRLLMTTSLSGGQWLACIGLSLIVLLVVEVDKAIRRRATRRAALAAVAADVPQRGRSGVSPS